MALAFNKQRGGAQKSEINAYKYVNGEQTVRLVGDVLARYVYWVKGENNKDIPFECLAFDRNTEEFNNKEKDWVKEYFPDLKCTWSYAMQVIDPTDGQVKVINLKRKLWDQIIDTAEDLGDPTDPDEGWDITFERKKTGPHAFNVEYNLKALKCNKNKRPLTDEEREAIKDMKSMDEVMVRPTPDAQQKLLERITKGEDNKPAETDEDSIEDEFDVD